MIKVEIKKMQAAFDTMDKWLSDVEYMAEYAAKALLYKAHDIVLERSPQYSGDFVANWKISYKVPDLSFQAGIFPEKKFPVEEGNAPFQRGDVPAQLYALNQRTGKLDGYRLGDTLWLANSAAHDADMFSGYAWLIEDNLVKLRPENYHGEGQLGKVKQELIMYYGHIDRKLYQLI